MIILEFAKFIFKCKNNMLPLSFNCYFVDFNKIHKHNTRQKSVCGYYHHTFDSEFRRKRLHHACLKADVESRTQGSRPRTQKNSEAKAKDSPSEDKPSRGQGQECSRPRPRTKDTGASVLKNFFQAISKKTSSKKVLLVLELRSRGFYVQAYADDLPVLVLGADMLWIRGMAQKERNIPANWASEQELQFCSKKTKIVLFTHKRNPDLGSLSMNGTKLELSKETRLL